jgi:3-oxoacyl-[acyl-carrier protein] reductase
MDTGLAGAGVLVTGGAGGIGAAVVRAFAAEGAAVAVHYRTSRDSAEVLAGEVGGIALGADLSVPEQADGLIPAAVAELGRLDVCVANAGRYPAAEVPVWDMPVSRWEDTIRDNLTVAFLTARSYLRHAAATGSGSLVFVASTAGHFGESGHADYAAAKGALAPGLLMTLKNEAARIGDGVRVNAVAPGWVATPRRVADGIDPAGVERATATMSLKKLATPQDVAAQVVVLASHRVSGHLSGAVVTVAGGMEGRMIT